MPRIVAAVAVVATIGISIGINIVRFPAVWDMLDRSTPARDSAQPAPAPMPVQSEPVIDLSQVAPPATYGLSGSETAPIRVPRSMPISLPTADEPSAGAGDAAPEAQLVSTRSGGSPEPAEGGSTGGVAGLSEQTLLDSPVPGPPPDGGNQAASPPLSQRAAAGGGPVASAALPVAAQTQWPAETVASMRVAARSTPSPSKGGLNPWRSRRPLVPVDEPSGEPERIARSVPADPVETSTPPGTATQQGTATGADPDGLPVFTIVSGKRLERLPPVDD